MQSSHIVPKVEKKIKIWMRNNQQQQQNAFIDFIYCSRSREQYVLNMTQPLM